MPGKDPVPDLPEGAVIEHKDKQDGQKHQRER